MLDLLALAGVGLGTGLLSGLFGVGGGFVLVPLLALAGWSLAVAIGTSLFYVVAMGVGGTLDHWRNRNLDARFVTGFVPFAMLGALAGARLAVAFPDWLLALALGVFLLGVARAMRPSEAEPPAPGATRWPLVVALGSLVGVLSGLFGVGGGVLFVPVQVKLFGVPIKLAVGNSMMLVLLTGLSGVGAHALQHTVAWTEGMALIAGGAIGLRLGLWLLKRLAADRLRRFLVAFLWALALAMLLQGLWLWLVAP